jgi:two-component sensor histidine kinase
MGVSRFDGENFENFDKEDGLPENTVFEVYEDEIGRVWFVGFPFQLSYFSNDSIIQYKYNSVLRSVAGKGAVPVKKSFRVDKNNNVYFSFINDNKIYRIDSGGELTALYDLSTSPANTMIVLVDDQLLLCNKGENNEPIKLVIDFFDSNNVITIDKSDKYSHGHIMAQRVPGKGMLFAKYDKITLILPDGKYQTQVLKNRIIWINVDKQGALWVGLSNGGVEKLNVDLLQKKAELIYLDSLSVTSVLNDNEGGKWFSTFEDGIFYLPTEGIYSLSRSGDFNGDYVKDVQYFNGILYAGMLNNRFGYIKNEKVHEIVPFDKDMVAVNILKAFKDEVLWICTEDFLYSYDKKHFYKYTNDAQLQNKLSRFSFSIKDIYPISATEVLLAESNALSILKEGHVVYNSYLDDNIELRIEAIERESDSSFLLGTFNGLWIFCNKRFEYLGIRNPLLKERITDIVVYNDKGDYVLGTKGSGLIVKKNDSIYQITRSNGLSSNSITSILISGHTIWVGTNSGLNLIDIQELGKASPRIVIMKKEHGLISNEITQLKSNKAQIYIVTPAGLTIFDRDKYQPIKYNPPIYVTGLSIMNRDTILSDTYQLGYHQNFIIISYTGISFRDGGNLRYKYRLKGLDNEWVLTENPEVEYAFLPPGKYQFEVIAINSEGQESLAPATLQFVILPPFWEKWWFILLVILFIGVSTYYFYSRRLRTIKKEHTLQSDLSWYRQQSLSRQMDPHFVFNTLNSIQSYIIKNDRLASSQYLSKFARLMRLILNNSQNHAVPLSDEIAALSLYMELESLRFQHKFEFNISTDVSVDAETCYIPAFLIQPFVENAIWHGIMGLKTTGTINVKFKKEAGQLLCVVEDNGVGRKKSLEMKGESELKKKSLGISLVKSRLNILNNYYGVNMYVNFTDLYNEDQSPAGTRVSISLPIIN